MKKGIAIISAIAIILTALPISFISFAKEVDFDTAFAGYETVPTKTYFDSNLPISTEGMVVAYNGVDIQWKGLGIREGNYLIATDKTNPYVVIAVNDINVIEAALTINKNRLNDSALKFFVSNDTAEWTELGAENVASKQEQKATTSSKTDYYQRVYRVVNLPSGTKYLKVFISTTQTWQPGLDYIDVFSPSKFDNCFKNYEATPVKTYFDDNTKIDTPNFVAEYNEVSVFSHGLGVRDGNYIKATNLSNPYVVIELEDSNAVEAGLAIHKSYLNSSNLKFYSSSDLNSWTEVPNDNIAQNQEQKATTSSKTDYYLRAYRIVNLPEGTKYLKIFISATVLWQPGLDYVDIYEKKGAAEEKIKKFNSITDGCEVVTTLLNKNNTLDNKAILGYKNWTFGLKGLGYRDAYSTQRESNNSADAELLVSATDDAVIEVCSVISESKLSSSYNIYYASKDGENFEKLGDDSVYQKVITASEPKPDNYDGLNSGYVARIERITHLPKGTQVIKIVTSTNNVASSWWQPGLEYIDIYRPSTEIKLTGYELEKELITKESKLDDEAVLSHSNFEYTEDGVIFKDKYSLKRKENKNSEIAVKIAKNKPVAFGYVLPSANLDKVSISYYSSKDATAWEKVDTAKIISYKSTYLIDSEIEPGTIGLTDLITALADDVLYLKAEISYDNPTLKKDAELSFIKIYKEYVNPYYYALGNYVVVEEILTSKNTLSSASIVSYDNWRFSKVGMDFYDDVGTQRNSNDASDATLIVAVDDIMRVEVATTVAKAYEGVTTNTYYTSPDGKNWTLVPAENIFSEVFEASAKNLLIDTNIGLVERIVNLPKGTIQLKIVTSTQNKKNSWWQPSINRITLYKDPFDLAFEGYYVVDKAVNTATRLSAERVERVSNWSYSAGAYPYVNNGGAVRNSGSNSQLQLSVVDTMRIEIATVSASEIYPHKFYSSPDGVNWKEISKDVVHSRVFTASSNSSLGGNVATVQVISKLPADTAHLKIVSIGNQAFSINYINFLEKIVEDFDVAFVGYGRAETLFNASRKLNDPLVNSYENWHFGTNGFTYRDAYSLQRDSNNCSDASVVVSVKDNQRLEVGLIVSNSWIKDTVTSYYASPDGVSWTKIDDKLVLKRYYTPEEDKRIGENYNVLVDRVLQLPEGTLYVKVVVSTDNKKNSWWQPGLDYIDIYSPYEIISLEKLTEQAGELTDTIQFTSDTDGLKHASIFSSKNLVNGEYGLSYTDKCSTRRNNYKDSELVISVDEDTILEVGTVIDKALEKSAENIYYTSTDGENWELFGTEMMYTSIITEEVSDNTFARVELLGELPSDTKYVKIVGTTHMVATNWRRFGMDYIKLYKGSNDFKLKNPLDKNPQIMLVGNFITIYLEKGRVFTIDQLTDKVECGKSLIYYYNSDGEEIFDGQAPVENGQKLVLKRNNKVKKEYVIAVTYIGAEPAGTGKTDGLTLLWIIGIAVGVSVIAAGAVVLILYLKKKKATH